MPYIRAIPVSEVCFRRTVRNNATLPRMRYDQSTIDGIKNHLTCSNVNADGQELCKCY